MKPSTKNHVSLTFSSAVTGDKVKDCRLRARNRKQVRLLKPCLSTGGPRRESSLQGRPGSSQLQAKFSSWPPSDAARAR